MSSQMMNSLLNKYDGQLQDSMRKQTDLVTDISDGLAAVRLQSLSACLRLML